MINTYNESHLHNTLKTLYALNSEGKTEVELDGHVYDIVGKDGLIIEIQTQNLSKLFPKIKDAIEKGRNCRIVFTIPEVKTIELQDEEGKIISKRKSPKKENIYSLFKDLTKIYPILLNRNFTLEVLTIKYTEIRTKTQEKVQAANKKRRFKKDWIKTDKKLDEITSKTLFTKKKDYLNLLPENLPEIFSSKDLKEGFIKSGFPKKAASSVNLILWVLNKMNLIEFTEKEGNLKKYRFV